jgi:hypothetical protein
MISSATQRATLVEVLEPSVEGFADRVLGGVGLVV